MSDPRVEIGEPSKELPRIVTNRERAYWADIREAVELAEGAWVPITFKDSNKKSLAAYARRIKKGENARFKDGTFSATQRDGKLWIRKVSSTPKNQLEN